MSAHFAGDALTLEEFERRVDGALRAKDAAELDALTADLPALAGSAPSPAPAARAPAPEPLDRSERQFVVAILGGNARKGAWTPARRVFAYAFWGGAELDFRDAQLPAGTTEVTAIAIMGGVDIIVPPGVAVDVGGLAILGGLEHSPEGVASDADAPRLKITGFACMGGVDIAVRLPGESAGEARRRRRLEAKERRRRLSPGKD